MTNYTLNNHLSYSIGDRDFGYRESGHEQFKVSVGKVDMSHYLSSNFADELRRTADSVYKEFGKDLVVFLSGGTDSEIVVRNFIDIGVAPTCVTIRFTGGYNDPDVIEAIEIAKELNLKLHIIDFDVQDFYNSGEASAFGQEILCTQITYLLVYHNILKLGAPSVMGGEALFNRMVTPTGSRWYYTFRENEDASAMRFSERFSIPLVNEWFTYTPELLLYYIENPTIQRLFSEKLNYKLSSVSTKNKVLGELWPDIRPKKKTHGFERLLGFNYESYKGIAHNQIRRLEPSLDGIYIDDLLPMLRGNNEN